MDINFKKMQGAGNDFIVIKYEDFPFEKKFNELAKKICHRYYGIGADGLLVVSRSSVADFKMQYYNSDGSLAAMCGNGIRCFAKFVYEEGLTDKTVFEVETLAGMKEVSLVIEDKIAKYIKVNMGKIIYDSSKIPVICHKPNFINESIKIKNREFVVTTVLMGVPHTVVFTNSIDISEVKDYGPLIEKHNIYPEQTNVNFAKIINRNNLEVRTWERGAGYTLACGTGVSSVVGIAYRLGLVDKTVTVNVEGGKLRIQVEEDESIFMEGPADNVCSGVYFA